MKELKGENIVILATTTAISIARETDDDEILILADFFSMLGNMLLTLHDRKQMTNDK